MKTVGQRNAWQRRRLSKRRGIAAFAAYALALSTVVFGALPVTPAVAAPGDGLCYLIADSGGGNGGNDLLTLVDRGDFDPASNETNIGTGTGTFSIEAMDMHPGTLQLYGANANRLGIIDKITGVYAPLPSTFGNADGALGTVAITDVDGLAFDYSSAVLWGAERQSANDLLVQIDITTGRIVQDAFGSGVDYLTTDINLLGHDDIDDLAFHPQTGVLYASITGGGGGRLVILDTATGHATDVGAFGAGDIEGMRFDSEGLLWGTSGRAPLGLYEIDVTTGAATNPRPLDNGGDYESTVCYVPGSDLQVNKIVDNANPVAGATITYTVEVFDAGPANATGIIVEDLLPAGVTYVSHTPSQGSYDETTGLWTVGSIPRRETATLDITATVDPGTTGSTITNTATAVAVDQGDAVPNNDVGSVDIFPDVYADLEVAKVVSNPFPGAGDTVAYVVTVVNAGPNTATGVSVDDPLPGGLTYVSSAASRGSYSSGSGVWTIGTIASGDIVTLDIDATVNAGSAGLTYTNTASIGGSDQTDPDPSDDSASVDLIVSVAGLEMVKNSNVTGPVVPGQTITYTLDIANTGTSLLDGIAVTDLVPVGTTFVSGSTSVTGFSGGSYLDRFDIRSYGNSDGSIPWTSSWTELGEGTSPTGGDIQVRNDVSNYQLRIRDKNNGIQREADLDGIGGATVGFDFRRDSLDRPSEIVFFEVAASPAGPWRELARFVGPATDGSYGNTGRLALLAGELTSTTTFRFTTSNRMSNGDRLWVDNFFVDLASGVAAAGHDAPSLVAPSDGYTLPAAGTMQITFEVVAETILTVANIDNTATVDAIGATPAADSVSDPVAQADLSLTKSVDDPAPNPGDLIEFTVSVANDGPSAAALIEVTDLLPSGVTYDSDDSGGAYDSGSGVWSVGSLTAAGSATLVITASVDGGTAGTTITNNSAITQIDRPDPEASNNTASASIYVPAVDLAVGKVVDNATPHVDDTVVFTVTVANNGPDTATGVTLNDVLPAGVTYVSSSAGRGAYAPGTGVWTVGTLAGSTSATLDLTVTVDPGTYGTTITNTSSVAGVSESDTVPTNDSASVAITIGHDPAVQVVKSGPASASIGDSVTYTFTVSHTAASDQSPVTIGSVADDVAGPAGFVSGDTNGNLLLDGGETWVFDATHVVAASDPDPITNTVTVTATDQDGDALPEAADTHATDVEYLAVLNVVKSGPASALIGDTVTYTFAVSHDATSDDSPVAAVTVTDDFAGPAVFLGGDDGDGLLAGGETWVFTLTYTVTAVDPDPLVNTGTATGTDLDGEPVAASGSHSTDVVTPAAVGDSVWHDRDGDGVPDIGEPGLDGVTVNLRDGGGTIIATTVTVGGGDYSFTGLAPGTYVVDVDDTTVPLDSPILSTGNEPFTVMLAEGDARTTADFGYYEPATLGDFVWDDTNGDGTQDPGEPGIGGATIRVYDPSDLATPLYTTTTLRDGSYGVPVVPGDYVLEFVLPDGYTFTTAGAGSDDTLDSDAAPGTGLTGTVTVASAGSDLTNDAGAYRPVTIGDLVWDDLDTDGETDAGESGIGGVTVRVFDSSGTAVATVTTAVDGSYLVALPPGTYDAVLDVATLPAGYVLTTSGTVTTPQLDSGDSFDLADFGAVVPTHPISGTIWNDSDVDTSIDGGEPRLGGATIGLFDGSGSVVATVATVADGTYLFPPVSNGDYTVRVDETTLPAGMTSTTGNNPEAVTVAGGPVTGIDFGYAFSGTVIISKTPDGQMVVTGGTATFTITVTNPGAQDLTSVVVTDPATPSCSATLGSLAAGAATSYSCSLAEVTADFTNLATVAANDEVGNIVGHADTGDVNVIDPSLTIAKTPEIQTILLGGTATFAIMVTNTGDVALSNIVVGDTVAPGCDTAIASLPVGASTSSTCTLAGITGDVVNTAVVVAEHPAGGTVSDSDTAGVEVIAPAISISKTPDVQTILSAGTATFSITVANDGDSSLSNVVVTDALAPGCDAVFATLGVGAAETFTCSLAGVAADFTNTADVVADHAAGGTVGDSDTADVDVVAPAIEISKTPDLQTLLSGETATFSIAVTNTGDVSLSNVTVTDAPAPGCDATFASLAVGATETYTCTLAGVTADFTNTADVVADHPAGGTVGASDAADVEVVAPAVTIDKAPDLQTILSGDTATFTITVTNTGDVDLSNLVVTDALAPGCDATFGSLAATASVTYACTLAGVTAAFTNTAVVTADHPAGGTVSDSDTAAIDVVGPSIIIEKTPDTRQILSGGDATFTITVTNTGDVDLSNLAVTDALAPGCDATFASLATGATATYTCTLAGVTADLTNTAVVTADHPAGGTVNDSDTAEVAVIDPGLTISKTPDLQQILVGGTATFTITVTNTGDVDLSNVAVTDTLAPGCSTSLGTLGAGASASFGCTLTGVAADLTNTAVVTADHPAGASVGDSDTADVDVITPAISITKSPAAQQILSGGDVTFTITVANSGDVDLSNVAVTDTLAPDCDATVADLAAGASSSFSCTLTGVVADMTNTAVVQADHPAGGVVSDSDTAAVDVVTPAITVDKTPNVQQVLSGGSATFTVTVTNSGDVDLSNAVVTDSLAPNCDATFASLSAGASEDYSCTLSGVTSDLTNTAAVIAQHPAGGSVSDSDTADVDVIAPAINLAKDPAVQQILSGQDATFTITVANTGDAPLTNVTITDPLVPACDTTIVALGVGGSSSVTCSAVGVTSGFTNTASVVATHEAGGTVSAAATADVEILVPAIDIQKTPDLRTIASGGTATFTITVTNAGTIPLSNVVVTDPLAPACDTTIGALAVGAATAYNCSLAGVTVDFTNSATVDATDAVGNPASDSDVAHVDVIVPAISISKSPDGQTVVVGGTTTFTIDVTNTGDAELTNVVIADALAPGCDTTFAALAVGASESYSCTLTGVTADFTNVADVIADHPAGGTVIDSDTADVTVLVPGIDIRKTPDTQLVGPDGTATFTITVTNIGATPLADVVVTDALAPGCDATFASLAVGASESYTCTLAGVAADFTNTAEVTADDPLLNPVAASDTAAVDLVVPAITLSKTPNLQTLLSGEDATFSVTISNTGDTELSNVLVTDLPAPGCDAVFPSLAVGESRTVGCTVVAVVADFTNVASVIAATPLGTTVTDSDDAFIDVVAPGVEIQKTPDTQQIHTGEDAVFTITVTNTGDQDLADLTVTDTVTPSCGTTIASLSVGATTSYSCSLAGVVADLTNVASVAGTDALGNLVSDSDDAAVDVIAPAISISKSPDAQTVVAGGTVTFTIGVTNSGDVDLSGVTVADVLAPACGAVIGNLAAGTSSSYTCTLAGVAADLTNTAVVTGTDPIGLEVTDADSAEVTILVPGIDIQKTPDLQQVRAGDTATFTITVTNAGATDLAGVTVTDPLAPDCDAAVGALAVGAAVSYACTLTRVTADFTNTAGVGAVDPLGNPVTDSDVAAVDVMTPAITISKSPDGQTVVSGGTATFTIEVTNTGDTDLTAVSVSDPLVPACDAAVGALAVGASTSYTCTVSGVTADFTNAVSVVAIDQIGLDVTDADTAEVTVLTPGVDIQKTPDIQTVVEGDTATFIIIVTNTGSTDLSGVAVSDPAAPACDAVIGDLPVGSAPVSYACTVTATSSFTNTASVAASDPMGTALHDVDTADVIVLLSSSIAGSIAHDVAGNGSIGTSDFGLSGIDVTATWVGLDGVFGTADDEVFIVQTDGNGDYGFDRVPPGEYRIVVDTSDLPVGIDSQTLDPDAMLDGATVLTLLEDTTVTDIDFAYTATGSIGDTVFLDRNGNGTQDPGEPGLAGINVTVTWHGPDGVPGTSDDLRLNTTTVAGGTYLVHRLPAGAFTVIVHSSSVPAGVGGDLDQAVTLGPAERRDDVDFPLVGSGTIGDRVFADLDFDGVFAAGEPGVPGVTVALTWAGVDGMIGTADDLIFTTATDTNGRYLSNLLPAGDYLVILDDSTVPAGLGAAPPVTLTLPVAGTDMTADFPLTGNRAPVAVDDLAGTDRDTPVTITVLNDDSDPDGHSFAIAAVTDPADGTATINATGTVTYTPDPGFSGADTFTYTICEVGGVSPDGIPATGLCDTATVTVIVNDGNEPPGPDTSFQTVVVGDPVDPIPLADPEGSPVTVTLISGDLPPGTTLNPDGTFSGITTDVGVFMIVVLVCDRGNPRICVGHTHTIAVTPQVLPGPGDDPDPDEQDPDDPPGTLPFTGTNVAEMLWIALMSLMTGFGLVRVSRKRNKA